MPTYFVRNFHGQEFGPFSKTEIVEHARRGWLNANWMIRPEDRKVWLEVRHVFATENLCPPKSWRVAGAPHQAAARTVRPTFPSYSSRRRGAGLSATHAVLITLGLICGTPLLLIILISFPLIVEEEADTASRDNSIYQVQASNSYPTTQEIEYEAAVREQFLAHCVSRGYVQWDHTLGWVQGANYPEFVYLMEEAERRQQLVSTWTPPDQQFLAPSTGQRIMEQTVSGVLQDLFIRAVTRNRVKRFRY